jgi:hypothetical protein
MTWQAKPNHRSTGWYVCSGNVELASVNQVLAGITAEECEANARLMAGAKELLAACEALHAGLQSIGDCIDVDCSREFELATAAIAKATESTK